jgi:hypothetical protein
MIRIHKIILFSLLVYFMQANIFSQTKIQVVTRTIQKSFEYKPGYTIDIKGEKANIQIRKSDDKSIKVKIFLISKNPSRNIAESDLKYCNYKIIEVDKLIKILNFFNTESGFKDIGSNLSARIEIEVPSGISIKIKNIYGAIELNNIDCKCNIIADFGLVRFSGISGILNINSNCSDINGINSNTSINITAQNADIEMNNINSPTKIRNQYGKIELTDAKTETIIDAEMTAITIIAGDLKSYSFELNSLNGDINVPVELKKQIVIKSGNAHFDSSNGNIKIQAETTYNNITLKTK